MQIGARDMAFPTLNMISVWVFFVAGLLNLLSFFVEGGAAASGWTAYPPLSVLATPGMGQDLWILSVALVGVSSMMGALNYVTTVIQLRAPGMSVWRLPMTVWGLLYTSILNLYFVPVVAGALTRPPSQLMLHRLITCRWGGPTPPCRHELDRHGCIGHRSCRCTRVPQRRHRSQSPNRRTLTSVYDNDVRKCALESAVPHTTLARKHNTSTAHISIGSARKCILCVVRRVFSYSALLGHGDCYHQTASHQPVGYRFNGQKQLHRHICTRGRR